MPITSVHLKNWKNHQDCEVKLTPGINLIYGPNHHGKTAILQAIYFDLTGDFPLPEKKGGSPSARSLLFHGKENKPAEVSVDYAPLGALAVNSMVRLKASIEGTQRTKLSRAVWSVDDAGKDKDELAPGDQVIPYVETMLGSGGGFIKRAHFLEEGEIFEFIIKPDAGIVKEFDHFFQAGAYRKAASQTTALAKEFKREEGNEDGAIKDLQKVTAKITQQLTQAPGQYTTTQIAEAQQKLREQEADCTTRIKDLQEIIKTVNQTITRKSQDLQRAQSLGDLAGKYERLKAEEAQIWTEMRDNYPSVGEAPDEQALTKAIEDLETTGANLAEKREDIITNVAALNGRIAAEQDRIKNLEGAGGTCPLCEQTLSAEHKSGLLETIRGQITMWTTEITQNNNEKTQIETQQADTRRGLSQLREYAQQWRSKQQETRTAEKEFNGQIASGGRGTPFADLTLDNTTATRITEEQAKIQQQSELLQGRVQVKQGELAGVQQELNKVQGELSAWNERATVRATGAGKGGTAPAPTQSVAEEQAIHEARRKYAVHAQFLLEVLADAIEETTQQQQKQRLDTVKNKVADIWRQFHTGSYTVEWTEDFLPLVTTGGTTLQAIQLSEAERLEIFLAFRVALAAQFGNGDFLLLDEPFHHLDPQKKAVLYNLLADLPRRTKIKQVIITSFEAAVRDGYAWDNLVELP